MNDNVYKWMWGKGAVPGNLETMPRFLETPLQPTGNPPGSSSSSSASLPRFVENTLPPTGNLPGAGTSSSSRPASIRYFPGAAPPPAPEKLLTIHVKIFPEGYDFEIQIKQNEAIRVIPERVEKTDTYKFYSSLSPGLVDLDDSSIILKYGSTVLLNWNKTFKDLGISNGETLELYPIHLGDATSNYLNTLLMNIYNTESETSATQKEQEIRGEIARYETITNRPFSRWQQRELLEWVFKSGYYYRLPPGWSEIKNQLDPFSRNTTVVDTQGNKYGGDWMLYSSPDKKIYYYVGFNNKRSKRVSAIKKGVTAPEFQSFTERGTGRSGIIRPQGTQQIYYPVHWPPNPPVTNPEYGVAPPPPQINQFMPTGAPNNNSNSNSNSNSNNNQEPPTMPTGSLNNNSNSNSNSNSNNNQGPPTMPTGSLNNNSIGRMPRLVEENCKKNPSSSFCTIMGGRKKYQRSRKQKKRQIKRKISRKQ